MGEDKTGMIIIPQSTVSYDGKIHSPIKMFHKVKGWIRLAFSYHFHILMRLCPRLYSSFWLFHWAALADWLCTLYLNSERWQVTVHCQKERTPLLLLSPLLSRFEAGDLSPPVSVYMLHYCRFKLWLWGSQTFSQVPRLLCTPEKM